MKSPNATYCGDEVLVPYGKEPHPAVVKALLPRGVSVVLRGWDSNAPMTFAYSDIKSPADG